MILFFKLKSSFIYLKPFNEYILPALGEAQAKVNVLEQELSKAERTIQRSKKAALIKETEREKEVLTAKLRAQEEDFRAQNQALLEELSNVSLGLSFKLLFQSEKYFIFKHIIHT